MFESTRSYFGHGHSQFHKGNRSQYHLVLQIRRKGLPLRAVPPLLRGAVARDGVVEGAGVVEVESGHDAGPARAADRRRDEGILECRALVDQQLFRLV